MHDGRALGEQEIVAAGFGAVDARTVFKGIVDLASGLGGVAAVPTQIHTERRDAAGAGHVDEFVNLVEEGLTEAPVRGALADAAAADSLGQGVDGLALVDGEGAGFHRGRRRRSSLRVVVASSGGARRRRGLYTMAYKRKADKW